MNTRNAKTVKFIFVNWLIFEWDTCFHAWLRIRGATSSFSNNFTTNTLNKLKPSFLLQVTVLTVNARDSFDEQFEAQRKKCFLKDANRLAPETKHGRMITFINYFFAMAQTENFEFYLFSFFSFLWSNLY